MNDIDLFVGVYSPTRDIEKQILSFLYSLHNTCDLRGVNVFVVERTHRPTSVKVKDVAYSMGFQLSSCQLPPAASTMEDTSRFTDWMVGIGKAPWFIVSHFDVVFNGSYTGYVRDNMQQAEMIGNHHDGIVAVKRGAYNSCQVGFCGVGNMHLINCDRDIRIIPADYPGAVVARPVLSLDVGELLALRMCTIGMRHLLIHRGSGNLYQNGVVFDEGKSNLFYHARCGSGHDVMEVANEQILCQTYADH